MLKQIIFGLLMFSLCCHTIALSRSTFTTSELADVILRSTYSLEANPQRTDNCFAIYIPEINAKNTQYKDDYSGCLNATAVAKENLKKQVQEDIATIEQISDDICKNFKSCSNNTDLHKLFDCYYSAANSTRQSAFEIENISKNKMQYIEITQDNIEYNQTQCTDTYWEIYYTTMRSLYANLILCLDGKPHNPPVTSTTQSAKNSDEPTTTSKPESTNFAIDSSSE